MNKRDTEWHLDKRVPIALIFAMVGQVIVITAAAAFMFKDIETNRSRITTIDSRLGVVERSAGQQAVQLGRIEESIRGLRDDIGRLLNVIEEGYRR